MTALNVGHALETDTQIGPVVDETHLAQNLSYIDIARAGGGTVTGGDRPNRDTVGYFMTPVQGTLFF